jgi:hypothetical protein
MKYSRTHVRATWLANAKVLCTEAKSSTWIATTRLARKATMRSARSLPGAPPLFDRHARTIGAAAHAQLPPAADCDTPMIEGQARAGVLDAPFVIVVGITRLRRKREARVVRVVWAKL